MYKRDESFDKGYEDWYRSKKTSGLRKIISECVEAVREIAPDRGEDGEEDLKRKILAVCYATWNYQSQPIGDWPNHWREKRKEFRDDIQSVCNHTQRIIDFIERQARFFDDAGYSFVREKLDRRRWVQYKINSSIQFDSKTRTVQFDIPMAEKYPPPHRVLHAYMEAFHDGLLDYLHELENSKQPFQNCHGALYYPDGLPGQAMGQSPELNSLLFHLVFIFRQYTSQEIIGDRWYQKKDGPMLSDGKPCYQQVAEILNSVNSICNHKLSQKQFSVPQIRQKIYNLHKKRVSLNAWASPFFLSGYRLPYHTR